MARISGCPSPPMSPPSGNGVADQVSLYFGGERYKEDLLKETPDNRMFQL